MKEFTEEFAILSKRMNNANADQLLALVIYNNLSTERDLLLIRNVNEIEVGIYDVPNGHVVVSDTFGIIEVAFHEST